jgi:lysozyme
MATRGIDVSNHQERIDWARVNADGIEFALIKATEGVGFVDPKLRAHAAGARGAGIRHGFYHFARPDTHSGTTVATVTRDARAEADAFLAVAFPRPGNLLPALDLETGGLGPRLLVAWTTAWLERVTGRIGAKPLVYTYPAFWSLMGNTSKFASYPLWIANYGVTAPQLPDRWTSYAIWQYTSNGRVPGIPGRVDLNRLGEGVTLAAVTFRPRPAARAAGPNLPGPVPKPDWFWPWARWHLGVGEFEGLARNDAVRPDEAPDEIPDWAWATLEKLVAERQG